MIIGCLTFVNTLPTWWAASLCDWASHQLHRNLRRRHLKSNEEKSIHQTGLQGRSHSWWCASLIPFGSKSHIPSCRCSHFGSVNLVRCRFLLQSRWHLYQQNRGKTSIKDVNINIYGWLIRCHPWTSISRYLTTTSHTTNSILSIKPLLHSVEWKIVALSKALLIWLHNPILWTRKLLTQTAFVTGMKSAVLCTLSNPYAS